MNKTLKWSLILLVTGVLIYVGVLIYSMGGLLDSHYSKKDLIYNYNLKTKELADLKNYCKKIVPDSMTVDIEFDRDGTIEIFHVVEKNGYWDSNWGIKIDSPKADTLLQKLGWTNETLLTLKEKLDDANCISIESGEPFTIGYQRSGMGKYFYKVFDQPLNDSMQKEYNNGCTYIYYKENIVLEFGGGAIGRKCFEESR